MEYFDDDSEERFDPLGEEGELVTSLPNFDTMSEADLLLWIDAQWKEGLGAISLILADPKSSKEMKLKALDFLAKTKNTLQEGIGEADVLAKIQQSINFSPSYFNTILEGFEHFLKYVEYPLNKVEAKKMVESWIGTDANAREVLLRQGTPNAPKTSSDLLTQEKHLVMDEKLEKYLDAQN